VAGPTLAGGGTDRAEMQTDPAQDLTRESDGKTEPRRRAGGSSSVWVEIYRVIDDLHNAITFDLRPDRLSLWVVDGIVSRAAFF
jgi:hypothetical protein